jgi:anhydro-N-acetylmuramic acid kinase|tara:strand:+ start:196 stop:1365 length:1170 start_codon:yes stop_codon:yes gene_type:complete
MSKNYYSLGLMSGTSGDGVDASIIQSDGENAYKVILDKYFVYNKDICKNIHKLKEKINNPLDLINFSKETESLEKKITLFHAEVVDYVAKKFDFDFIGFHGQTIFHDSGKKISRQLGNGKLLSYLSKKTVVYNFRENDQKNGGEGAPLTPIFHALLVEKFKTKLPTIVLNIGGIANVTVINDLAYRRRERKNILDRMNGLDIGPGNCLIDQWMKKNSKKNYDIDGSTARSGKINKIILEKALDNWQNKLEDSHWTNKIKWYRSYDIKDFDLSFVHGLSLKDGAATLTEYTSEIYTNFINNLVLDYDRPYPKKIIICGGGRKNKFLIKSIAKKIKCSLDLIDKYGVNGDFVESQAFAYLAIRSYLNLPISFPGTTGVNRPCPGGTIIKNF